MENKKYWKDKLTKTLVYAGIAFFVSLSIFWGILSEGEQSPFIALVPALFFSGIPAGWSITKGLFGGWIIVGYWGILVLIIRLMLSVIIGIFALPIQICLYISKYRNAPDDEGYGI